MNEYIQNEMERLRIQRNKDLHNAFVDRLREADRRGDDLWTLADSVFTPEELAGWSAEQRRLGLYLKLDFATFWLSILFLNSGSDEYFGTTPNRAALDVILIDLLIFTIFGFFVLFFLRRSNRQGFTREFLRRLGVRREEGEKDPVPDRDMIGFRRGSGTQQEKTP